MYFGILLKPWNVFSGSYYLDQMSDDEDDSIANRPGPSVCILYSNLCLTIPRNMLIFNMVKMRYRCVDITGMGMCMNYIYIQGYNIHVPIPQNTR